jgi:chemotaxis protein CheD
VARQIPVKMAEMAVCRPDDRAVLVALGLGSCIGLCLYDPVAKVAGMAHVVLPDSSSARRQEPPGKYADTAVSALILQMSSAGAVRTRMIAAVAGGAHVFSFGNGSGPGGAMDIGARNAEAVLHQLRALRIPVAATDVGGSTGRTVHLFPEDGLVTVRLTGSPETELVRLSSQRPASRRAA